MPVSARNRRANVRGMRAAGRFVDAEVLGEVLDDPGQQRTQRLGVAVGDLSGDELRLPPGTVGRHDHPPGGVRGGAGTELLTHQVQRGVQPGGGAGPGHDRAVLDVEDVLVDEGAGEPLGQEVHVTPVGGAAPAVEESGLAQHEGSGAVREDERALQGELPPRQPLPPATARGSHASARHRSGRRRRPRRVPARRAGRSRRDREPGRARVATTKSKTGLSSSGWYGSAQTSHIAPRPNGSTPSWTRTTTFFIACGMSASMPQVWQKINVY